MIFLEKEKFDRLPLKKYYTISFFISTFIAIVGFLTTFLLPPVVPLYYGLPQSQQQLAPAFLIILPSFISVLITIGNAYFSIFADSVYLKRILAISSLAISILASITTIKIILLVGNLF